MAIRTADAEWRGNLQDGQGHLRLGSGAYEGNYSFRSRMGDGAGGTNPEELIGAAHAGCFSMALSAALAGAGFTPTRVHTTARVHFNPVEGGFAIGPIDLETEAVVPGIDEATFQRIAGEAKVGCPVSQALASTPINLQATLVK
jgi:osmotically inducible protein OsmC